MPRAAARALLLLSCLGALLAGDGRALAQDVVSPSPAVPLVEGGVQGTNAVGRELSIRVDATMPGGWQGLHLVDVELRADGRPLDHLTYDIEDARVTLDGHNVVVGTGASADGNYVGVAGATVVLTTGGANLSLRIDADVLRRLPESVAFELSVTGDRGETATIRRSLAAPPSPGLTWTTVVTAVVVALFAGGLFGGIFASRRRPPPRLSVYATVQRRLELERAGKPM